MWYEIIVLTLLLPTVLSAAVVFLELLTSGSRPRDELADRGAWLAGGVAAAGSFLLSYWLYSWTMIDPTDHWHWLPQAAVVLTITALLAAMAGRAWACAIVVPVAVVFAWLMTPAWDDVARIRPGVSIGLAAAMLAYLGIAPALADDRVARRRWLIGLVLTLNLVAAAVVIERSGWASLAQLSALPIVVMSVLSVASVVYPRRQFLYGAIPTFAVFFPAALLLAWYGTFASISLWAFALPAYGPLALLLVLGTTARFSRGVVTAAILSTLVFPIAGVVVALVTAHS